MPADGEYTAVVDRFEGDLAVLLLERDGATVDDITIQRTELPESARHQDAILRVKIGNETIQTVSYDPEETDQRKERAQSRFDSLSQRPSESEPDSDADPEDRP